MISQSNLYWGTSKNSDPLLAKKIEPECDDKVVTQVSIHVCLDCYEPGCLHEQFNELGACNHVYFFNTTN